jgi:hypothetical protein
MSTGHVHAILNTPTSGKGYPMVDWERNWRGSGIGAVLFFIVASVTYGGQPKVDASPEQLVSFYDGDRTRIFIASIILGFAILNLLWFGAALTSVLRDAGKAGWGTAATTASAVLGGALFLHITLSAALAYSIAGSGNPELTSALNDVSWVLMNLALFPAAMLIMSGSFGLLRAGLISTGPFAAGMTAMAVLLVGTTTWASDGFWSPSGAYSRLVATIVFLAWVTVVSGFLTRSYSAQDTRGRAAVPAA